MRSRLYFTLGALFGIACWNAAFAADIIAPTSIDALLQNVKQVGDSCRLLDRSTFSQKEMLRLFGAKEATFFGSGGGYAKSEDYLHTVQVRAGGFSQFVPDRPGGIPNLQLVGSSEPTTANVSLRFGIGTLPFREVQEAIGEPLIYVRKLSLPNAHGFAPYDPSYYTLAQINAHCRYDLRVHFNDNKLDEIALREDQNQN